MKYACPRCGSVDIWKLLWPFGRCLECRLFKPLYAFRLTTKEQS